MSKYREPLDTYDLRPSEMTAYLRYNGWHFNKKLCDWAVSHLRRRNTSTGKGEPLEPWTRDRVDEVLKANSITLENATGYDYVYIANMARADFYKSSLATEQALAQFIKDYVDDIDQQDGFIMNRFYADAVRNGMPIPWEEVV